MWLTVTTFLGLFGLQSMEILGKVDVAQLEQLQARLSEVVPQ